MNQHGASGQPERGVTRILVALNATRPNVGTLEMAVELGALLRAEVAGLLVEDVNLLRLAGMPFAREVCRTTAQQRSLETDDIERQLRTRAEDLRQALAHSAERVGARWSFSTARGVVANALLEAAEQADLISLGADDEPPVGHAPHRIPANSGLVRPIVVIFGGGAAEERALILAARLARDSARPLVVLLAVDRGPDLAALRSAAETVLRGVPATYRIGDDGDIARNLLRARREQPHRLILGAEQNILRREAIDEILARMTCPVLLVR